MTDQRAHAARVIRERRIALGLSVQAAADRAHMARNTWLGMESARTQTQQRKYAAIERALGWTPGSMAEIVVGREPREVSGVSAPAVDDEQEPLPADIVLEVQRIRRLPLRARDRLQLMRDLIAMHAEAAAEQEEPEPRTSDRRAG